MNKWKQFKKNLNEEYEMFEAAISPEEMKGKFYVDIKWYTKNELGVTIYDMEARTPLAEGAADKVTDECNNAFIVTWTSAVKGWGPMLYDIMLEIVAERNSSLAPDRESVSDAARKVWAYYFNKRSDVVKRQLDDLNNTLTPTHRDNCMQKSANTKSNEKDPVFPKSPLSFSYSKPEPKVLTFLRDNNLVRVFDGSKSPLDR